MGFKSYYVVWKLRPMFAIKKTGRTFKSYYVVWKLLNCYFLSEPQLLFKSYYVVWKPENENDENNIWGSLNRTMQYGNYI